MLYVLCGIIKTMASRAAALPFGIRIESGISTPSPAKIRQSQSFVDSQDIELPELKPPGLKGAGGGAALLKAAMRSLKEPPLGFSETGGAADGIGGGGRG